MVTEELQHFLLSTPAHAIKCIDSILSIMF